MVVAYCDGKPNPQLSAELQAVIDRWTARGVSVEVRADDGQSLVQTATADADWGPDPSEDEVQRIIAEPGGMLLADFWKRMGVR